MRGCNETITLFNARRDGETGGFVYLSTVIAGCSWHRGQRVVIDAEGGLMAADEVTVRIPVDADFGGRAYVDPVAWRAGGEGFTLQGGDIAVKGRVTGGDWTPAALKAAFAECFTVLGVTDNTGAPRGGHWRLTGA